MEWPKYNTPRGRFSCITSVRKSSLQSLSSQIVTFENVLFPSVSPTNGFVNLRIPSMSLFDPPNPLKMCSFLPTTDMTGLVEYKITKKSKNSFLI